DLCAEIARQLAPKLRPKYVALSTRRVIIAPADDSEGMTEQRFPDVGILSAHHPGTCSGTAIVSAPLVLPANFPEPIPHVSVEIRDVAQRRLVTCIEVLSPTNKRGPGREDYLAKCFQILSSQAHLVEIDLLRGGARFPTREPLPTAPYFVFISHAERRQEVQVWPIALEQPLPIVPIPLLPGDPAVQLDLQQALAIVYEIIGYDELIDYSQPPPGPLTPAQSAWVEEQLRRADRRTP
ncbi:MAG: DUF4058 family protein, partial [Gemmataceae bacterium]